MTEHQLSTADLQAMTLTAAIELANRWISEKSDQGAALRTHIASGAGIEMLVQLAPSPALGLRLVDSDGSYLAIASFEL